MRIRTYLHLLLPIGMLAMALLGCGTGNNDGTAEQADTREVRCTNCPTLQQGQDTLAFINEVRTFVASHADDGLVDNDLCDNYTDIALDTFPVDEFLNIFEADQGVASAGLCSKLMVKILLENGIDAYMYSFGARSSGPHGLVLVKHANELWVVDPRLNYTLMTLDNRPLNFFDLIVMVAEGRTDYVVDSEPVKGDLLIDTKLVGSNFAVMLKIPSCKAIINSGRMVHGTVSKRQVDVCYRCDLDKECDPFSKTQRLIAGLKEQTTLTRFHEGMVLKRSMIVGAADEDDVEDRVVAAIYSQPELGKKIYGIK